MKYFHKLSLVMVAAVVLSGLLMGLFPKKASAAISLQDEYKVWRSYTLLADCVGSAGWSGKNEANAQDTASELFDNGVKFQDGALYSRLVGNDKGAPYDCNTLDDVNKALTPLGFDDMFDFTKFLGSSSLSKAKVKEKLQDRAKSQGARLGLDSQADFQFWFYDSVYRSNLDNKGCSGILSNEFKADRVSNIGNGSTGFYSVSSSGEVKNWTTANYKVPVGDTLKYVDQKFTKNNSSPTCGDIARNLTKARAEAYATTVKRDPELNNPSTNSGNVDDAATGDSIDFECTFSNALTSWFMCPLIDAFGEAVQALDSEITKLLTIETGEYFDQTSEVGQNFREVWLSIRTLALIMLVIIGLIMVIGTAVEIGPFDAYTVKKVMPRLLVAIIVIMLSWQIVIFLIEASNALAIGISALIQAPFINNVGSTVSFDGGQQTLTAVAIIGLLISLGPVGVLSFVATALLGIAIAFFVLVLREILVILLAVLAPLAIAAYILPNTQKIGKMWWDFFSKALLMFPIIAAFIATGRVFALVASSGTGNDGNAGTLNGFIAFVAYFGPYFALPFTFKLAGGAIGQIGGIVNDRSRGAFDRLRNYRKGQSAENFQKIKAGERFNETNAVASRLNKIGAGAAQNPFTGAGFSARNKQNIERLKLASKDRRLKEDGVNNMMMDDDVRGVLLAGAGRADSFLAAKGIAKGSDKYKEIMGAAKSVGFSDSTRLAAMEGESSHGKGRNMEALSTAYGAAVNAAGDVDQSDGMRLLINDIGESTGMTGTGTERLRQNTMYQFGANGRGDLRQETVDKVMDGKFDTGLIRGMTDAGMKSLAGAEVTRLQTGSQAEKEQAAAQLLALHESRTGLSQPAIKELDDALTLAGVDLSSQESLDMQLAGMTSSPGVDANYKATRTILNTAKSALASRQQAVNDEVAVSGTASPATMAALNSARVAASTAETSHNLWKDMVTERAQDVRAKSATYSSSLPYQAREQP